jgi:hypothetical protein
VANFRRHVEIATLASGMLSTMCLGAKLVSTSEAVALWITGSFGGILPDIDSDNSSALDIVFSIITLFSIVMLFSILHTHYSTLTLWGGCLLIYGLFNFLIRPLFEAATIHRGIFHSIIAGLFFAFAGVNLAFYLGKLNATFSWLIGLFVLFGFITHLLLDEVYSVDFNNTRIKRSFGTALKLFDYNNLAISAMMLVAVLSSYYLAPKSTDFYQAITNKQTFLQIKRSFFPSTQAGG